MSRYKFVIKKICGIILLLSHIFLKFILLNSIENFINLKIIYYNLGIIKFLFQNIIKKLI